ncbi:MAG: hypothetical protein PGN11_17565 [Quadrisphaera sp.]
MVLLAEEAGWGWDDFRQVTLDAPRRGVHRPGRADGAAGARRPARLG